MRWTFRAATADDSEWPAVLKAEAMRRDLERLGLWDRDWARGRFLAGFVLARSRDARWIGHFSLSTVVHGRRIGGEVLAADPAGDGGPATVPARDRPRQPDPRPLRTPRLRPRP